MALSAANVVHGPQHLVQPQAFMTHRANLAVHDASAYACPSTNLYNENKGDPQSEAFLQALIERCFPIPSQSEQGPAGRGAPLVRFLKGTSNELPCAPGAGRGIAEHNAKRSYDQQPPSSRLCMPRQLLLNRQ